MTSQCSNVYAITILNDFSSEEMISFQLNIPRSDLQLLFETSGKSKLEEKPGAD